MEQNNIASIEDKVNDKLIEELEQKLASMKDDKETKLTAAKEQLIDKLSVTADQYHTATGTAEALRTLRFALGSEVRASMRDAVMLANEMANEALAMATKASELECSDMGQLCDGFYEPNFVLSDDKFLDIEDLAYELAFEMMRLDLCRNVGGAAEDIVSFMERVDDEIAATQAKLDEMAKKGGSDE